MDSCPDKHSDRGLLPIFLVALINHHSLVPTGQRWPWVIGAIQRKEEVWEGLFKVGRTAGGRHHAEECSNHLTVAASPWTPVHAAADDAVQVKERDIVLAPEQIFPASLQLWMTWLCDIKSRGSSGTLRSLFVVFVICLLGRDSAALVTLCPYVGANPLMWHKGRRKSEDLCVCKRTGCFSYTS